MARKADNRKGEFREVFEEARKAGFARVRINGLIQRLEDVTALDKKKKHTIEIVDRPRHASIRPTARASPTRSRPRVKAGGGSVLVAVEGEARERAYSEARACPNCGVGLPELSPQSFSFNSPLGMCVDCNGLGSSLEIDPDLIVPNPNLSIGDGAIEPWGDRAGKRARLDRQRRRGRLARVRHPPRQALEEPDPAPARGAAVRRGREAGEGRPGPGKHGGGSWAMRFAGVVNTIKKRMQETTSEVDAPVVRPLLPRAGLPRLQRPAPAARVARGAAGRQEPRRRDRDDGRRGVAALRALGLKGARAQIAARDPEGGQRAPRLPARRRARVPDPRSRGGDAVGRRGAAHPAGLAARARSCRA